MRARGAFDGGSSSELDSSPLRFCTPLRNGSPVAILRRSWPGAAEGRDEDRARGVQNRGLLAKTAQRRGFCPTERRAGDPRGAEPLGPSAPGRRRSKRCGETGSFPRPKGHPRKGKKEQRPWRTQGSAPVRRPGRPAARVRAESVWEGHESSAVTTPRNNRTAVTGAAFLFQGSRDRGWAEDYRRSALTGGRVQVAPMVGTLPADSLS